MQKIGTIQFVQVQRAPMKIMIDDVRTYRPDPLLKVDKLLLTADGVVGFQDGIEHIDAHNANHEQTRHRAHNKISFGFTIAYDDMRQRFGQHMDDGIAAENIILQAEGDSLPDIAGKRLFIRTADDTLVELTGVMAAAPCREFSIFCHQREIGGSELKDTLQFLDNGRRGYYAILADEDCQCFVQAGDELLVE